MNTDASVEHSASVSFLPRTKGFTHSAVCLMTGSQPLPKPVLHTLRSSASLFNLHYPLVSLRSLSSCLRLLPRFLITSILQYMWCKVIKLYIHTQLSIYLHF